MSSISSTIQLFSEEGIIHRWEEFYQHKNLRLQVIFIQFKTRSSTGVNVLGGIYVDLIIKMSLDGFLVARGRCPHLGYFSNISQFTAP